MLLRPDALYIDQATKRAERLFPRGEEWLMFRSKFPAKAVFEDSVLEPAVGLTDDLAAKAFAAADWQNWVSTTKVTLYEIGTRVGLPPLENTSLAFGLSKVYNNLASSVNAIKLYDDPAELVPQLLKNAGMQIVQQLAGQSNMVAQTIAQVLAAAVWAVDVVAAHNQAELAKNVALPPLQTEEPATDSWQVNRAYELFRSKGSGGGIVYPDGGAAPASNADYTNFYLPAYRHDQKWIVQHRATGVAAQQGHPREARSPAGETQYHFDIGDGSTFGFMPGTTTTLRVLQASFRYYHTVRGTPVDRYTIRCRGVDKPCYKTVKAFDGSKDCRQCVTAESVWPTEGLGWAYGGAPLNATTPGENVGAFYPSTNKLLFNLLEQIAQPGPLLYTINVEAIEWQWRSTFERFWEFAAREWQRHRGYGWRGLVSRLVTLMSTFDAEGERRLGGRDPLMPLSAIADPRGDQFSIPFEDSIFSQIIQPYCRAVVRLQARELDTVGVAYVPPGAGALYHPGGKLRRNELGDRFMAARRGLLNSTKRMLVDLRQVSDPEYRAELQAAGVKPSPVNPLLHGSPGVGDATELLAPKRRRQRLWQRPMVAAVSPLTASIDLARRAPRAKVGARPRVIERVREEQQRVDKRNGLAIGIAAAGLGITAATVLAFQRSIRKEE